MRSSTAIRLAGVPEARRARHPVGDGLGLGDLVGGLAPRDAGAGGTLGDEVDTLAGRAGEQLVGRGDDLGGRAVVADQVDARGGGEALGELTQVARVGTGEGVDRLGGVTHDAQLVAPAEPQVEQGVLEG